MVYSGATGDWDNSTYGVQWCNWGFGQFNLWYTVVQLGIGTIQLMVYSGTTGDCDTNLRCTAEQLGTDTSREFCMAGHK